MSVAILLLEMMFVAAIAGILSYYYGDWHRQHVGVTVAAFLSWYLPLLIVCVLPVDISVAYYHRCLDKIAVDNINSTLANESVIVCRKPWLNLDPSFLIYFWRIVYWTSQFLTWILLPVMQSFAKSGNFTFLGKLKAALIDNAVYYGSFLLLFIVLFTYVVVRGDIDLSPSNLKVTVISAANTWGLFLVILFLGYGLVEVPRRVWRHGNPELSLRRAYFQLSRASMDRVEYEEELEDCLKEIYSYEKSLAPGHYLRNKFLIILEKSREVIPTHWTESLGHSQPALGGNRVITEKDLIYLHKRLKLSQQRFTRSQALWNDAVQTTLWLEAVEFNRGSRLHVFRSTYNTNEEHAITPMWMTYIYNPSVEYYWKCCLRPLLFKAIAIVLIVLSVTVVWSECTFFVKSVPLSIYALVMQTAAQSYNFMTISFISFITIGYLCFAVYSTVFRLRIFNYFQLVGNHQSDENSMIFCGMLLCRLTPPLCLNFLGLVHLDSHVFVQGESTAETAYTHIMGHLDLIPFIASGFNTYFPMMVLVLCLCTMMRLGTRCLHACGFDQFIGSGDELTQDAVEEGKSLIKREKALMNKQANRTTGGLHRLNDSLSPEVNFNRSTDQVFRGTTYSSIGHSPYSQDGHEYPHNTITGGGANDNPSFVEDNPTNSSMMMSQLIQIEPVEYNEEDVDQFLGNIATAQPNRPVRNNPPAPPPTINRPSSQTSKTGPFNW